MINCSEIINIYCEAVQQYPISDATKNYIKNINDVTTDQEKDDDLLAHLVEVVNNEMYPERSKNILLLEAHLALLA